jgi:hypothetical protein
MRYTFAMLWIVIYIVALIVFGVVAAYLAWHGWLE